MCNSLFLLIFSNIEISGGGWSHQCKNVLMTILTIFWIKLLYTPYKCLRCWKILYFVYSALTFLWYWFFNSFWQTPMEKIPEFFQMSKHLKWTNTLYHCYFIVGDCPTSLYKNCTAWTGGNDLDIEGKYVWDKSNTSFVFTNWYKFVPSNGDIRDCIDIFKNGEWNDRPCSHLNHFICEK